MSRGIVRAAFVALLLVAPSAVANADDAPDVRLGSDVVPVSQAIRLRLDADRRDYSGSTDVALRVDHATNVVRLHALGQTLTRVVLRQAGDSVHVTVERGARGLLTLATARPLRIGTASLEIEFAADYGTRAVGLYRAVQAGRAYLFTQFESDDAREAFPCWDEPGFKIPYQLTVDVPAAHAAVSNTPVHSETVRDGWKTVVFAQTPPLPSYLLAIVTGPLEFTPVPGTRVPTRIVTTQGQSGLTTATAAMVPGILAGLERWFGTPYPFEKLDLVAVPEFAYGAMENAGAITFRDGLLLLDPTTASVDELERSASTTCHELAHMWFGDLVTLAWWDDLWLNESFADWMAAKVTDEVYPGFKENLGQMGGIQRVMRGDTQPSTVPIRARTTSSAAGLENVGLVYDKGNAVLSTFENYLGPDVFQKGVRAYLAAHAWGNASAADLWKALDTASGQDVSAAMATFTDQPGVPLVRVTPAEGGVRLTQSRCTPWGVSQPDERWRIPVAMRWSDGRTVRTERVMLTEESQVVKLPATPAWVMPNAGGTGYFAWSEPGPMLEALAAHAQEELTPAERVSLLGDLDLLLDLGEVHGDAYLRALSHFGSDPEPFAIGNLVASLRRVRSEFVADSERAAFVPFVRRTLRPALDRFGMERRPGEDEAIGEVRGDLLETLASDGGDPDVAAFADAAARRYLADPAAVDPGIVVAVLAIAAHRGDAALFDEYRGRFETAAEPQTRRRFLVALGAFEDPALQRRALDYTLAPAVRPTEGGLVLRNFGDRSEARRALLFEWMTTHYAAIAARVPPPSLRYLPMMAGGCSAERLAAAKAFFGQADHAQPGIGRSLERLADQVNGCISLREREGAAVNGFLRSLGAK